MVVWVCLVLEFGFCGWVVVGCFDLDWLFTVGGFVGLCGCCCFLSLGLFYVGFVGVHVIPTCCFGFVGSGLVLFWI